MTDTALPPEIAGWFDARGWRVRRHQAEMLAVAARGQHALLVADTGAGKTAQRGKCLLLVERDHLAAVGRDPSGDLDGVLELRTLDDARKLRAAIATSPR